MSVFCRHLGRPATPVPQQQLSDVFSFLQQRLRVLWCIRLPAAGLRLLLLLLGWQDRRLHKHSRQQDKGPGVSLRTETTTAHTINPTAPRNPGASGCSIARLERLPHTSIPTPALSKHMSRRPPQKHPHLSVCCLQCCTCCCQAPAFSQHLDSLRGQCVTIVGLVEGGQKRGHTCMGRTAGRGQSQLGCGAAP